MAALDGTQKADVYETLSSLNMAFAGILQHLQTLQRTGLFKSKTAKLFPSFTQELQAAPVVKLKLGTRQVRTQALLPVPEWNLKDQVS